MYCIKIRFSIFLCLEKLESLVYCCWVMVYSSHPRVWFVTFGRRVFIITMGVPVLFQLVPRSKVSVYMTHRPAITSEPFSRPSAINVCPINFSSTRKCGRNYDIWINHSTVQVGSVYLEHSCCRLAERKRINFERRLRTQSRLMTF